MSIEVLPVGQRCNLSCPYCYEHPMRDAGNFGPPYDLDAMKRGIEAEHPRTIAEVRKNNGNGQAGFTVFGGEPLLMPIADLEEMFRWGLEKYGHNGIQTNGSLITPEHIRLFRKYHVGVGLSIDGPDELNDSRWAGSLEKTREMTRRSMEGLGLLIADGNIPSVIVTLHRGNAIGSKLDRLGRWFEELDSYRISSVRLHSLEVDHDQVRGMALTEDENVIAMLYLMALQDDFKQLRFEEFKDMARLLLGDGKQASCVWGACDPLTTSAVRGVSGDGTRGNCGRTNKDGIDWVKADAPGFERYIVLHSTPQEHGGCKDCRFFYACKGQCPGTAINGDWRNRSELCRVWYRMFEALEQQLIAAGQTPVSCDAGKRAALEQKMVEQWLAGNNQDREHGDHWDAPDGYRHSDGPVEVHGDNGTTTMHGDTPHQDHIDTMVPQPDAGGDTIARHNGFSNAETMNACHQMVLDAIGDCKGLEVLDLGAGDGHLLYRLRLRGAVFTVGIESDRTRVRQASGRKPEGVDVRYGRIEDYATTARESFGLVIISQNRFDEMGPERTAEFRTRMKSVAPEILIYSYDQPRWVRKEQM